MNQEVGSRQTPNLQGPRTLQPLDSGTMRNPFLLRVQPSRLERPEPARTEALGTGLGTGRRVSLKRVVEAAFHGPFTVYRDPLFLLGRRGEDSVCHLFLQAGRTQSTVDQN